MTRGRRERHKRTCRRLILAVLVVIVAMIATAVVKGNTGQQEGQERAEIIETGVQLEAEKRVEASGISKAAPPDRYAVFDSMSRDWGDEAEGFVFYEIPPEYEANGGYFPEIMQIYTYCLCRQEGVSYPLIVAMIERESGYRFDCIGDDGGSSGYMQIMEVYHADRMEELNCTDLMNPYQNVRVGISLMKDLIEKYGTVQDALAAYNYGETGARRHLWSKGIYVYEYNEGIMRRMREIEEELKE